MWSICGHHVVDGRRSILWWEERWLLLEDLTGEEEWMSRRLESEILLLILQNLFFDGWMDVEMMGTLVQS